jgi:hypothetical protein
MKWILLFLMVLICLSTTLWYTDGAWENGVMPTIGLVKTIGFAILSVLFFVISSKFNKGQ